MAENKTKPTKKAIKPYLDSIENETRRADSFVLLAMLEEITQDPAVMWGESLIGFNSYHYKYKTGREGDMLLIGFSPRKQNLAIYLTDGCHNYKEELVQLGPHKTGKSCLYITQLKKIDLVVLKQILTSSYNKVKALYH